MQDCGLIVRYREVEDFRQLVRRTVYLPLSPVIVKIFVMVEARSQLERIPQMSVGFMAFHVVRNNTSSYFRGACIVCLLAPNFLLSHPIIGQRGSEWVHFYFTVSGLMLWIRTTTLLHLYDSHIGRMETSGVESHPTMLKGGTVRLIDYIVKDIRTF